MRSLPISIGFYQGYQTSIQRNEQDYVVFVYLIRFISITIMVFYVML